MTDARAPLASLTDTRLGPPPAQHTPNDAMLFTSLHTPLPVSFLPHIHTRTVTHTDAHFFWLSSTFMDKRIKKEGVRLTEPPCSVDILNKGRETEIDRTREVSGKKRLDIGVENVRNADTAGGAREKKQETAREHGRITLNATAVRLLGL